MEKDDVKELLDEIKDTKYDAIVIGSGFGGAVAVTKLADEGKKKVLVLERGTWWGNPEGPGLPGKKFGIKYGKEDKQWWPRPNSSQGLIYILNSMYKEKGPIMDVAEYIRGWFGGFFNRFRNVPIIKDIDLGIRKNRKGLYRYTRFSHENGNVDVLSGNGVGGGSLFYSAVNLVPHKPVLERNSLDHLKGKDFKKAIEWMKDYRGRINKVNTRVPVPHRQGNKFQLTEIPGSNDTWQTSDKYEMPDPILADHEDDYLHLDRARVLKLALKQVKQDGGFNNNAEIVSDFKPLPLSIVEFDPKVEGDSEKKNAFCVREGRCIAGCLPSARHTLYKTLLKLMDKVNTDNKDMITVVPQTKVSHIDRGEDGNYDIHFTTYPHDDHGELGIASAKKVFVAAGCLGTTEIMLRSQKNYKPGSKEGLPLNEWVGKKFSTNGDFFAFIRDVKDKKNTAEKDRLGKVNPTYGPINSSGFHLVFDKDNKARRIDVHVEDSGIPTMFAHMAYELIPVFKNPNPIALIEKAKDVLKNMFVNTDKPDTTAKEQASFQTERELISDLFFLMTIGAGPNEPLGSFKLDQDEELQLEYNEKKLSDWDVFKKCEAVMKKLSEKMNGTYVSSPFWDSEEKRVVVVHPLGGCPIAKDGKTGAVDQFGRVFDKEGGILEGLYVVDAAAIPGALAVNPTLTIVTQAVKSVDQALKGW